MSLIKNYDQYLEALEKSPTEMFWVIPEDVEIDQNFGFDIYFPPDDEYNRKINHVFLNGNTYDGVMLMTKHKKITKKEFDNRFPLERKEWNLVASNPKPFEKFYFKSYNEYLDACKTSQTEMFWWIPNDIILCSTFNFEKNYYVPIYDKFHRNITHVFKNGDTYDGLVLFSKNKIISEKEFNHRFFIEKKEVDIVASCPVPFEKFYFETYEDYLKIKETTKTEMFWMIPDDVELSGSFKFDYYVPKYDYFHRNITHVFKNGNSYDGVALFSKHARLTKKEFEHRFYTEKKEVEIVASIPKPFPVVEILNYEQYLLLLDTVEGDMFWGIWPEIEVTNNSVLNLYFTHHDTYNRHENHMFKNKCFDIESYYNGLTLFSKYKKISKKEFDRRYLIEKKEYDAVASSSKYKRYVVDSYEQYLNICEKEIQPMFWCIWPEVEVTDESVFDLYFNPRDGKYDFDRSVNHVFSNQIGNRVDTDGIVLFNKQNIISKKEIDFRFVIDKKYYQKTVSKTKLYDIVFISYNEKNADENYLKLKNKFSHAKRVHGVKGIHQAHIEAAKLADSHMFWVVDGDAEILEDFNFDYLVDRYEKDIVYVWKSINPINDLVYGYGGVKLLPKDLTLRLDTNSPDMTTSISSKFRAMSEISNITAFNTDEFSTWKSAFRECVKLASSTIDRQSLEETQERLEIWCTKGINKPYGDQSILGANMGRKYGEQNKNNLNALRKINDFNWLYDFWEKNK